MRTVTFLFTFKYQSTRCEKQTISLEVLLDNFQKPRDERLAPLITPGAVGRSGHVVQNPTKMDIFLPRNQEIITIWQVLFCFYFLIYVFQNKRYKKTEKEPYFLHCCFLFWLHFNLQKGTEWQPEIRLRSQANVFWKEAITLGLGSYDSASFFEIIYQGTSSFFDYVRKCITQKTLSCIECR